MALLTLFTTFTAQAEYRVYQYIVKNKIKTASDQKTGQLKVSSLDPVSYLAYHGGSELVSIDLLRTWICPGHTAGKTFCPSPYAELTEEDLNEN